MSSLNHPYNPNGRFTKNGVFNGGLGDTRFFPIAEADNEADANRVTSLIQETRENLGESYQIEVTRRTI
jgi:hypothetical protein